MECNYSLLKYNFEVFVLFPFSATFYFHYIYVITSFSVDRLLLVTCNQSDSVVGGTLSERAQFI